MAERGRHRRQREREQKASSQKKKNRKALVILEVVILVLVLGTGGYCIFDRVMDGRTMGCKISVCGVNVTWLSVDKAAEKLQKEFQKTKVVFRENGKTAYEIPLEEAGYSLDMNVLKSELEKLKEHREDCRILFEKHKSYTVPYRVIWDDALMKSAFSAKNLEAGEKRTESVDAYITYREDAHRYEIVPSVLGNVIENAKLLNHTQRVLNESFEKREIIGRIEVEVGTEDYRRADVTEDQNAINEKLSDMNRKLVSYEKAQVTYTFGSETELLDSETIRSWIQVDEDEISLNEEAMRSFVAGLGERWNTQYVPREFLNSYGETVIIENNEYGYWIDEDGEYARLVQDLESGEAVKREPVYKAAGIGREGNDDLVEGYVEVNLTTQYLWLYYQGGLICESSVVTGQPVGINAKTGAQEDWSTYLGSYPIAYTEHPATLSSDIYGYECDVQYWMPFVYGQGLHDATWRGAFGGEIYKTDGSHGCVNLPLDVAAMIYEYVDTGFPVIIYE